MKSDDIIRIKAVMSRLGYGQPGALAVIDPIRVPVRVVWQKRLKTAVVDGPSD
jgi:hypothetical protein